MGRLNKFSLALMSPEAGALKRYIDTERQVKTWGWLVTVSSFFTTFIINGISCSVSLYHVEWLEYFQHDRAVTSVASALHLGCLTLAGAILACRCCRLDHRQVAIFGGLLAAGGLVAAAFSVNVYLVYIFFGVWTGFGLGLSYAVTVVMPDIYHRESPNIGLGVAIAGAGSGATIMPFLTRILIDHYTWRGSLVLLAGVALNLVVCGALLRQKPFAYDRETEREKPLAEKEFEIKTKSEARAENLDTWTFRLLLLHVLLYTFGKSIFEVGVVEMVYEMLPQPMRADTTLPTGFTIALLYPTSAIFVTGLGWFVGAAIHGAARWIQKTDLFSQYMLSVLLAGIGLGVFTISRLYPVVLTFCAIVGVAAAAYEVLFEFALLPCIPAKHLSTSSACSEFMASVGYFCGAPLGGYLIDRVGYPESSFYMAAACIILSYVLMLGPWWKKCHRQNTEGRETVIRIKRSKIEVTEVTSL